MTRPQCLMAGATVAACRRGLRMSWGRMTPVVRAVDLFHAAAPIGASGLRQGAVDDKPLAMTATPPVPVDLAFHAYGEHGEPVVVLHGLLGSGRNWASLAKRLGRSRRAVTLDLRNHGRSPWNDAMNYDLMAADVQAFIERSIGRPVILIGHSMGGKTAMRLALNRPALIQRLVVVDIAPVDYAHGFGAYVEAMRRIDPASLSRRADVDRQLATSVPDPAVRAFLMQNLKRRDDGFAWRPHLAALAKAMPALMAFPTRQGDRFSRPTLFLAGGRSDYLSARHREVIPTLFPDAEIRTIADAGHWLHAEQPAAFMAHLERFLDAPS